MLNPLGGNVGIGTTAPGSTLSFSNTFNTNYFALRADPGAQTGFYGLGAWNSGTNYGVGIWSGTAALTPSTSDPKLLINGSGNVGIGNTAPLSKLGVTGGASFGATYGVIAAPTSGMIIEGNVGIGTATVGSRLVIQGSGSDSTTNALQINNSSVTGLVTVQNGGNVGIGNTAPLGKLVIGTKAGGEPIYRGDIIINQAGNTEASNAGLEFKPDNGSSGYGNRILSVFDGVSSYGLRFQSRSNSAAWTTGMTMTSGGNVGINTTAPGSLLDIKSGSLRLTASNGTYVGFHAAAGTSVDYRLPTADGTNAQVLQTDGSGNLSWTTAGGGGGTGLLSFNGSTATAQTLVGSGSGLVTVTDSGTNNAVHTIAFNPSAVFNLGAQGGTTGKLTLTGLTSGVVGLTVADTAGTGTWTLPGTTDTIVGRATTDTLTNKTLTSPILTTPTLGVATATTLALGGATIGTNNLAVTGTAIISGDILVNGITLGRGGGGISSNTAMGASALYSNTTGTANIVNGVNTLYFNTTGTYNIAIGYHTLQTNTTGAYNIAIGSNALLSNTTGYSNVVIGPNALLSNTTGANNTVYGNNALQANTTGSYNTVIGQNALYELNITANDFSGNNTAIGYNAGRGIITGVNNTILGANVTGLDPALSNTIIIADGSGNQRIYVNSTGQVGIGTTAPAVTLAVVGDIRTGTSGTNGCVQGFGGATIAGTCSSDASLKTVVGNVTGILDKFTSLDLVTYHWNQTAADLYHNNMDALNTGYIAQQVEQQFPELVSIDTKGYRQLNYTTLSLYGLEAIKEMNLNLDAISGVTTPAPTPESTSFATAFFKNLKTTIGTWLADAGNGVASIFAGTITARNELCINTTCVTENQLKSLLSGAGSGSGIGSGGAATCSDGIKNQDETGIDTGGVCTPAVTLSSIAITTPATKLSYTVGDILDITGLVITGTYSDATTKVETFSATDISGFDSTAPITGQVLTISVSGKTTTYNIDVVAVAQ